MVYEVITLPEARQDIAEIFNYILSTYFDPITAVGIVEAIEERIKSLRKFPGGIRYDEKYRFVIAKRYKIFFYISNEKVYVVRVVHSLRSGPVLG